MEKYNIKVKGIVTCEDKYLIAQRWYDDRIEDPYQWEFFDGAIEFGESPDQAVIRMILEATGQQVFIDKILYTWSYVVGDICNIGISYLCCAMSEDVILSEEYIECKYVMREEFEEYIKNPSLLQDIERAEF